MTRRRSTKTSKKDEHLETLSSGDVPEGDVGYATEARTKGDATKRVVNKSSDDDDEPPPQPRVFRVMSGGMILARGYRTMMRKGKLVDDLNYDIARLQQQGIKLEEIDPKERNATIGSTLDV